MEQLAGVLPFILIAVIFWWLLIRPQRKRQLEVLRTQSALSVGDEVMLGSGIVGSIGRLDDDFVWLTVSPGTELQVARGAVNRVLNVPPTHESLDDTSEPPPPTP